MTSGALHTIMLPIRGDGKGESVLAHAAALARRFKARVRVVHCHPRADDMMPFGVVIPTVVRQQIEEAAANNVDVTRDQLRQEFVELVNKLGLAMQKPTPDTATARFIDFEGKQVDAVRRYGRLSDLICVAKPDPSGNLGTNTLKSALFYSGRPVMMCPAEENVKDDFADHVTIGWNGSLEATRAVAMSAPIIGAAKSVTILSSDETDTDQQLSARHLQRYLELRGVSSNVRFFEAQGKNVGRQLVSETRAAGAGILLIGAYHESFERESLFGGNSQAVVADADFPVVMSH